MSSIIEWASTFLRDDTSNLSAVEISEKFEALCCSYDRKTGARQIFAKDAIKMVQDGQAILLDIRNRDEYEVSCIPSAENVEPEFSWFGSLQLKTQLPETFADDKTIICSCTAGLRSGLAAVQLEKHLGRPIYNLHGGIIAWVNAGGRVVRPGTGENTENVHCYGSQWATYLVMPGYKAVTR